MRNILDYLSYPIKNMFKSLSNIVFYIQDYNRLSKKCSDNEVYIEELSDKNKELFFQKTQLKQDLNDLDNKNKLLEEELERAVLKNTAYTKKFAKYQDKVENSEKFKKEKLKVDNLRTEREKLEETINRLNEKLDGFDIIYRQQKKAIAGLNNRIEYADKELRKKFELSLQKMFEKDDENSSIIIGGSGKIIASTLAFREKFNFNDPDSPITGKLFFKVLKPPKDVPDYKIRDYIHDIKQAFRDPEKITLQTTILDGKNESKIIQFTKHEPFLMEIIKSDKEGQNFTERDYFYTTVDNVCEIGRWERFEGKLKRIFHFKNGKSRKLHEFAEKKAIEEIQEKEKQEKTYNQRMSPIYQGLIALDYKKWNSKEFTRIEAEKGTDGAETYLKEEYSLQKNKIIADIISGLLAKQES